MSFDPRNYPVPGQNPFADQPLPAGPPMNPYATPVYADKPVFAGVVGGPDGGLWREGNLLVMHKLAPLPDICLLSNQPATGRLKRSLRWHHPAVFLAALFNLLIYAILAIALSKTATIYIGISDEWRQRRIRRILFAWGGVLLSAGIFVVGLTVIDHNDQLAVGLIIGGLIFFFVALISGLIGAQLVSPKRITSDYVWLKGVHPGFLDRLPVWPYRV